MIRGDIRDSVIKFPDCEPISIWVLMRHGKRNPSINFLREMKETLFIKDYIVSSYERGNSTLCAQDIDNFRDWVIEDEIFEKVNQLSDEGYEEMTRIQASLEAYVKGLGNKHLYIEPPKDGFDILAPFKFCNKYINGVILNNATFMEVRKYQQTSEYLETKNRIQRRLGIDYSLTDENVMAIWNFCRSNSSGILNKFSPWCALLSAEDLEVIEYIEDLKHYYRNGYGIYEMSKAFGAIALSDILVKFQNAKSNGTKITSYVTDSTVMDMMVTALGLFKDAAPITGKERKRDRKWKTSTISTFSSNILAVLNRCGNTTDENFNVVFYYNEEPLKSICNEGVCSWKEFEDKFTPFLDTKIDFC
ncbi:unnamed protein product [Arctia plantaginis]|uniref:Multiple inositol polyphosphate phosphatase 1 n=1 Tax=Arctia plantaginis TaxID=874455 RepID=A0A8S1AEG5_ARCPL|nr:unnamed protein product [Arctia plantaginis]